MSTHCNSPFVIYEKESRGDNLIFKIASLTWSFMGSTTPFINWKVPRVVTTASWRKNNWRWDTTKVWLTWVRSAPNLQFPSLTLCINADHFPRNCNQMKSCHLTWANQPGICQLSPLWVRWSWSPPGRILPKCHPPYETSYGHPSQFFLQERFFYHDGIFHLVAVMLSDMPCVLDNNRSRSAMGRSLNLSITQFNILDVIKGFSRLPNNTAGRRNS